MKKPRFSIPVFRDPDNESASAAAQSDAALSRVAQRGLLQIGTIVETIYELPAAARDNDRDGFLADVRESLLGVAETIRYIDQVTPKQQQALDNWASAVERIAQQYSPV